MMHEPAAVVHLNVRSWFSLLCATASVEALTERAAQTHMAHLAIADTNVLYGAVAFQRACLAAAVQPIIGMTACVEAPHGAPMLGSPGELTLLATGPAGYRSLCRLTSLLQATPACARTRLTWDELKTHHAGLICLSGGRRGWVDALLRLGERAAAGRVTSWLAGVFGERAWLSIDCSAPEGPAVGREIEALAARFGLGVVAAQPIYCLEAEERSRLHLLAAIARNTTLDALAAADRLDGGEEGVMLHWPTPSDMAQRYAAFPAALHATVEIAAHCQPALPDGRPIWPVLALPAARTLTRCWQNRQPPGCVGVTAMCLCTATGCSARSVSPSSWLPSPAMALHRSFCLWLTSCAMRAATTSLSRRAAASRIRLVAYCVGITTVDPIEHDLLFERFLNPARSSLPDIDLDLCSVRRDEVLGYVRQRYGAEQVAMVATVSTLRLRSALRKAPKPMGWTGQRPTV
jgi:DNA polymerase III alpha subunit